MHIIEFMKNSVYWGKDIWTEQTNRKNDLILIMTPEKQDKTLELSKHRSPDSTLVRKKATPSCSGQFPSQSLTRQT